MKTKVLSTIIYVVLMALFCSSCKSIYMRRDRMAEQINQLNDGVLLVRLKTSVYKIKAYQSVSLTNFADETKVEQKEENKRIMDAFKANYDFSSVYFFYSMDSDKIRREQFEGVVFDANQKIIPAELIMGKPYLIAEFGDIFGKGENVGYEAIVVKDANFQQLVKPFPYGNTVNLLPRGRKELIAVANLNQDLHEYYHKGNRWRQKRQYKAKMKALKENR